MGVEFRVLVLGAGGFVGRYLIEGLAKRLPDGASVHPTSLHGTQPGVEQLDILDTHAVSSTLDQLQPTHVVNLAGIAAPVFARRNPDRAWSIHATAVDALGRALLRHCPDAWLIHVSSGLVYGRTARLIQSLEEHHVLDPMDPYTVTKAAGDLAVGALATDGLKTLRVRPFNHFGPGQTPDFVIPAFASQLAAIMAGKVPPVLRVGNLEAERDFLDVRDVVDAYILLVEQSDTLSSGSVYNVASGQTVKISCLLDRLIALSGRHVEVAVDSEKQRPSDIPRVCGSAAKIEADIGWAPKRDIDTTLSDVLEEFLERYR